MQILRELLGNALNHVALFRILKFDLKREKKFICNRKKKKLEKLNRLEQKKLKKFSQRLKKDFQLNEKQKAITIGRFIEWLENK